MLFVMFVLQPKICPQTTHFLTSTHPPLPPPLEVYCVALHCIVFCCLALFGQRIASKPAAHPLFAVGVTRSSLDRFFPLSLVLLSFRLGYVP